MKQIIITVPDSKYKLLMDFVKSLKIDKTEVDAIEIPEAHKAMVRERVATYSKDKLMSEKDVDKKNPTLVAYLIKAEPRAFNDVQQAVDYYNEQQPKLGEKFYAAYKKTLQTLKRNPYFQIRYDAIRCLVIKSFPYMIHFSIDEKEKLIIVFAVVHTSLNPDKSYPVIE